MGSGKVAVLVPTNTYPVVPTRVLAISLLPFQDIVDPLVDWSVAFR
jgi:hypothetical protein